jgi:alpha-glucoside transport system substrate-binding protein
MGVLKVRGFSLTRSFVVPLAALLVAVGCATGSSSDKGSVSVLAAWGGSEQDSFMAMVKPFTDRTGIKINYTGTRDTSVLTTRIQAGNPPDLAGLPGPGQMYDLAKQGKLISLDGVLDSSQMSSDYAPDWIKLGQYNGKTVGIFIKTSLKGLVWYVPKNFQSKAYPLPKTWDDLLALQDTIKNGGTAPWCIGLASSGADGWPGTDWVKDIVLTQAGPSVYDQWAAGKQKWTTAEIKTAFQTWGTNFVAKPGYVYGGTAAMKSTDFADSATPMFASPPKCYMHHQASFMSGIFVEKNPALKPTTDFSFFPMPPVKSANDGGHVVAGDLFGMFKDTSQARALMKYLVTAEAQTIWVKRGGALSANKKVDLAAYPDDLSRQMASILVGAKIARFDAGDLMPPAMQSAFWKAVLDYVSNPGQLDSILTNLDKIQADAYK